MRPSLLVVALAVLALDSARAEEWMVEAHYPDRAALTRAAGRFQHVAVDAQRKVLRVDTDEQGIAALEDAGLSVGIDTAGTAQLRAFQAQMQAALQSRRPQLGEGGYPTIPGFSCYRTVEGTYQTMDDLVAATPNLAEIHEIGPTWQKTQGSGGYTMRALRVTNLATAAADPDRPKMVVFGSIHAREYTPAELLTRMAEWLVHGYGTDAQATWLVDHVDFRFVLQANPDGRKKAETGIGWRKNTNTVDGACPGTPSSFMQPGIDLNRNFPFHWNTTNGEGSSDWSCDQTFHGPAAGSEPETQNLVRYVAGTSGTGGYSGGALPDRRNGDLAGAAPEDYAGLFFDIHSYSQLVLWSWGDTQTPAPNDAALRSLGRRLAWFNDYTPQASVELYPTDGTTDDTFYGLLGAPSYTIELGTDFFESCSSFTSATYPKNLAALKYAARTAPAPYRLASGPDVYDLAVSPIAQGGAGPYVTVSATVDDTRYNQSNGTQATYGIWVGLAYVDTPPWQPGAVGIPLMASDGAFDSRTEAVSGNVNLSGLAPGRHLIYVQGVNMRGLPEGTPGAPDAVFVEVPGTSGIVVTTSTNGHGAIVPSAPQTVAAGTILTYTVTAAAGFRVGSVSGCDGSFTPPTYTTAPVSASCDVHVETQPAAQHTIGGTITGLQGSGLALTLNGLVPQAVPPAATTFAFSWPLFEGSTYDVAIGTQPNHPPQICSVQNGHGTVTGDVTDIAVSCVANHEIIFADGFDP